MKIDWLRHMADLDAAPVSHKRFLRNQIESLLNQNLQPVVKQVTNNLYIDSVTIENGVMNITGHTP